MSREEEKGVAAIRIELRNSTITVFHGTARAELASGHVYKGAWDAIWDAIYKEIERGAT